MLRIAGAAKPYKTLVKTAFAQVQNCSAQTLIKPVVYECFLWYFDEKGAKSLEKHYVYKVPVLRIAGAAKPYKTLVKQLLRKCRIAVRKPL